MGDLPIWPLIVTFIFLLYHLFKPSEPVLNVPTVKFSRFLPTFVNRLIYYVAAPYLIYYGYRKYPGQPYRVLKTDGDFIILPIKYIDELRQLPPEKLSSLDAQFTNVLGEYTNILIESFLPSHTVSRKLTPAIGRIIPRVLEELKYAFDVEVPKCEGTWSSVNVYDLLLRLVNRAASRIIAGDALCRNEEWLKISANYTLNVGITIIVLRPFPKFLRPIIAKFLPSVKKLNEQLRFVKEELFVPMIHWRREQEMKNPAYEKPDDYLQWMLDGADNDRDREPEFLAHNVLVIMSVAIVHTSTMLMTQVIYDLLERPEYLEPLREEIRETLINGWENATQAEFYAQRRLDSFLKESQRLNPIGEVSMHRIVKQTLTLSDGFTLPKGTHICFPSGPLCRDPSIVPSPLPFDGFRWCPDTPGKSMNFVSIDPSNMHFGFGRQACPGRFFASNTAKAILSRLLVEYEIKFAEGQKGKPRNIRNGEQIMPNMYTDMLIRKRDHMV